MRGRGYVDNEGSLRIHDRWLEVQTMTMPGTNRRDILAKVDGEVIPGQRRVVVDSGIEETEIHIELVHLPTLGEVHISGYLIDEDDWKLLQLARDKGLRA